MAYVPKSGTITARLIAELKKHPEGRQTGDLQKLFPGVNVSTPLLALAERKWVKRDGNKADKGGYHYTLSADPALVESVKANGGKAPAKQKRKSAKKKTKVKKTKTPRAAAPAPSATGPAITVQLRTTTQALSLRLDEARDVFNQLRELFT